MTVSDPRPRFPLLLLLVAAGTLAFGSGPLQAGEATEAESCEDSIRKAIAEIQDRGWWGAGLTTCKPGMPGVSAAGLLVADVDAGGPAAKAGLRQGDVIVSFDGKSLAQMDIPAINRLLDEVRPGDRLHLLVDRQGRRLELEVQAAEMPLPKVMAILGNELYLRYAPAPPPQITGNPPPSVLRHLHESGRRDASSPPPLR